MIRAKQEPKETIIDLTGPQGNSFYLLGVASKFARQLGLDSDEITNEMTSGDYEHLIEVFDKYFGDFVILER
jgi:alanine-alpha-ketoisovalerate/valine-pyruvate aminotransferase